MNDRDQLKFRIYGYSNLLVSLIGLFQLIFTKSEEKSRLILGYSGRKIVLIFIIVFIITAIFTLREKVLNRPGNEVLKKIWLFYSRLSQLSFIRTLWAVGLIVLFIFSAIIIIFFFVNPISYYSQLASKIWGFIVFVNFFSLATLFRDSNGLSRKSSTTYIIFSFLIINLPLISTLILVGPFLHRQILNFTPHWSDEIIYWHQVATFRLANFSGGYYTVNELPAPASFTHFYAWGPIYPIIFGTLGKIIDWQFNYAPLLNIVFLSLAITWFIISTKPNYRQLILIGLLFLTFWPIQFYTATNTVLVFPCSLAVFLAAYFYKITKEPENISALHLAIFFVIICLITLFKVSWAILFPPFLFIIRKKIRLSIPWATVISCVYLIVSFLVFNWISAPYPNWFTSKFLETLNISLPKALNMLGVHVVSNLKDLFNFTEAPFFILVRIQMLFVLVCGIYILWKRFKDKSAIRESIVVISSCFLLLIETIVLYLVKEWYSVRVFAPVLLLIILLFIARKRMAVVLFIISLNLVVLPNFLNIYKSEITYAFPKNRVLIKYFTNDISTLVMYDKSKSAWDNTLLVPLDLLFDNRLLGIPAGIGISYFESADALTSIKSRYLLLDHQNYEQLKDRTCLVFLGSTKIGKVYINQGMDCEK